MKRIEKILLKVAKWNKLDYKDLMQNVKHKMATVRDGKEETNETLLKNENTRYKAEKYSIKTILHTDYIFYDVFYLVSMTPHQNKALRLYKFVDPLIQVI